MAMLDYLKVLDVVACNGNNLDIGKDHFLNAFLLFAGRIWSISGLAMTKDTCSN